MNDAAKRVERLRRELNEHNYRYYVENSPVVSDREFDDMMLNAQSRQV